MADTMGLSLDDTAVRAAFARVPEKCHVALMPVHRVTADNIHREAQARVRRATGELAAGITVQENRAGNGYVVLSSDRRMPNLPLWEEGGVHRGRPGSHTASPHPYEYNSARLELGPHERRVSDALQNVIDEEGLG